MCSTYIPGDCLPGLLDGWCGPIVYLGEEATLTHDGYIWDGYGLIHLPDAQPGSVMLDLRREEVCDRVARVLARVLGVPVGATAPEFSIRVWTSMFDRRSYLIATLGQQLEMTCKAAAADDDLIIPSLASIPLDSPDRDALALAEIARWDGAEIRAGRIKP